MARPPTPKFIEHIRKLVNGWRSIDPLLLQLVKADLGPSAAIIITNVGRQVGRCEYIVAERGTEAISGIRRLGGSVSTAHLLI